MDYRPVVDVGGTITDWLLSDYRPGIEALRDNCEAESGRPAPAQPRWSEQTLAEAAE